MLEKVGGAWELGEKEGYKLIDSLSSFSQNLSERVCSKGDLCHMETWINIFSPHIPSALENISESKESEVGTQNDFYGSFVCWLTPSSLSLYEVM